MVAYRGESFERSSIGRRAGIADGEAVRSGQMLYRPTDHTYNQVSDPDSASNTSHMDTLTDTRTDTEYGSYFNDNMTSLANLNLNLSLHLKLNETPSISTPPAYSDYPYEYDYEYEETAPPTTTVAIPNSATEPVPIYDVAPRISEVIGPYYWVKMAVPKTADKEQLNPFGNSMQNLVQMHRSPFLPQRQWAQPQTATASKVRRGRLTHSCISVNYRFQYGFSDDSSTNHGLTTSPLTSPGTFTCDLTVCYHKILT